jgi:hypothetical protein
MLGIYHGAVTRTTGISEFGRSLCSDRSLAGALLMSGISSASGKVPPWPSSLVSSIAAHADNAEWQALGRLDGAAAMDGGDLIPCVYVGAARAIGRAANGLRSLHLLDGGGHLLGCESTDGSRSVTARRLPR